MSTRERTLGWRRWRSILISLSSRLQSVSTSNARGIFLIATRLPLVKWQPEHTNPLAPC